MLMPRGWFYLEQVNYNRLFSEVLQPGVDYTTRRLSPKLMQQHEEMLVESIGTGWSRLIHHRLMAAMLLPALTKAQVKFAGTQTVLDEAVLACALEHFRLVNGRYPEALAELAPRFVAKLPHDLITGEPLKYRPTDNGRFILYPVGWNETDDGGKIALTQKWTPKFGPGGKLDFSGSAWGEKRQSDEQDQTKTTPRGLQSESGTGSFDGH
jgi:hypothetical protein